MWLLSEIWKCQGQFNKKSCKKDYSSKPDEEFKKRFKNTFEFSNNDISKFIFSLRKGIYPYEYINEWENINEASLPEKDDISSILNIEDITV